MDDTGNGMDSLIHDPLNLSKAFVDEWLSHDPFITAHTSGSTGKPKAIQLTKADMLHSALATCRFFNIDAGDYLYLPLSPDYIAGKMMIVRALASKANLYIDKPTNAPCMPSGKKFKLAAIVPSQIEGFVKNLPIGSCQYLIIGGGSMNNRQRALILDRTDVSAYATYGMTETCSHVALAAITEENHDRIFTALPGIRFTTDSRGCIVIDAPDYSFRSLITNDTADLISPTEFTLTGRIDNVINSGGIKLHPETIEAAISHLIDEPFYIASRPSNQWGHEAILIIERSTPLPDNGLMTSIRSVLPHTHCPKEIICCPQLKRTDSGKIIRQQVW